MTLDGLVRAASCTQQRHHLFCQHVAHADGVHLDELREHLAELTRQVLTVLLHLCGHAFTRQQRVEACVGRRVDIGGEVLLHIVHTVGHQIIRQTIEDVADDLCDGVAAQERVHEFIARLSQHLYLRPLQPLEQQERLVLDLQVGKGQLGRAVFVLRRRHQFVDVFFQMNLHGEVAEEDEQSSHRQPADCPMATEIACETDE